MIVDAKVNDAIADWFDWQARRCRKIIIYGLNFRDIRKISREKHKIVLHHMQ